MAIQAANRRALVRRKIGFLTLPAQDVLCSLL